jgi:HPt (histidine-containing phosphotransfer) domain-containing protein
MNRILNDERIEELKQLDDDGSNETLLSLIELYINSSTKTLQELIIAQAVGEPETIKQLLHSLRSSSLNLGVESLAEFAKQIEFSDKTVTKKNIDDIGQHFENVKTKLLDIKKGS